MKNTNFLKVTVVSVNSLNGDNQAPTTELIPIAKICDIKATGCGCEDGKGQSLITVETRTGNMTYEVKESIDYIYEVTSDCNPCDEVVDSSECDDDGSGSGEGSGVGAGTGEEKK